jgi:hypothetical protein
MLSSHRRIFKAVAFYISLLDCYKMDIRFFYCAYCAFSFLMQSEDDFSLSGIALTALYFDGKSQLLVSGDQKGTVNCLC